MIRLNNQSTRKPTAVCAIITILILSVAVTAISSSMQYSYAQTGVGIRPANIFQNLTVSGVTASGTGDGDDHNGPDHDADDRNVPANVLDNNLNTRWSNLGVGSFIQAGLGGQKTICSVDIAWYRGNLRVNNFVISASSDGTSFTNVFTGKSSGTTLSAETYIIPTNVNARFVRITVNGNTENNWASITELSVYGSSSSPNTNCIKLPIASVTANGNDGNLPANVLDNNLNTRWSNLGIGSFIQADLGGQKTICSVDIAWYRGNLRVNNFVISVSNDGTSFTNVFTGKSSGTSLSAETYIIPTNVTARFVRITVNGNTENNWASITELSVYGSSSSPNTNCIKLPIASVTANGNDGNLPANVLDNNLNTRWSNLGIGSFIQADLGGQKTICSVDIAWYRGNLRVNNFVISVSNDGTSFTNVFTGKSSGTSLSAETYIIPTNVTARFVRITVNGNTENNWASITELSVDGLSNNTIPTADNKSINTNAGTPVTITLTGSSPIPNDINLKFSVLTMPQNGKLATGTTSNTVTYTPNPTFTGTDTFTYKATDSQGIDSNIATVSITVNAAQNNPPTANNINIQTNMGAPVTITLTGTDPIPGDTLKFSV